MDNPEYIFEYATVHLLVGQWVEPGVRNLSVRTTFYVVDEGEVTRTTQTDPLEETFDSESGVHDITLRALAPQFALLGQEGWEVIEHKFSTTGFPFSQALLKRRIPARTGFVPAD